MDAFDTYIRARDSAAQNAARGMEAMERGRQRAVMTEAGTALSSGNATGARNALYGAGMLDQGMALDQSMRQQDTAMRERQAAAFIAGAQGLRRLPAEQRWQAYEQRVMPYLRQMGVGDDVMRQITPDVLDDGSLDSVIMMAGGEVEQPRYIQGERGSLDRLDPYTDTITSIRAPRAEVPTAPSGYRWNSQGALEAIPGGPADPRTAGALASSRRAPKSSGGGGRGSSSSSARPAAPSARPWERKW